jgi:hypothetical protein
LLVKGRSLRGIKDGGGQFQILPIDIVLTRLILFALHGPGALFVAQTGESLA